MADLFYCENLDSTENTLSETESMHCVQVMRKKIGDEILVSNGKGVYATATITNDSKKSCAFVRSENFLAPALKTKVHMAVAPTKNTARFDWFLEKATEIGVSEITPLICNHSERRKWNTDRWQKILIAAMKQSQQFFLPRLNEATSFVKMVLQKNEAQKFICFVDQKQTLQLKNEITTLEDVLILIGPEGDFTTDELLLAKQNNFKQVSLGPNRLRTETAALVAAHTVLLTSY